MTRHNGYREKVVDLPLCGGQDVKAKEDGRFG